MSNLFIAIFVLYAALALTALVTMLYLVVFG